MRKPDAEQDELQGEIPLPDRSASDTQRLPEQVAAGPVASDLDEDDLSNPIAMAIRMSRFMERRY